MKKILFINNSSCGGAERMTILYAKILYDAGFDCKIITQVKPGELQKATILNFIPENINHEEVFCRYRYFPLHLFRILKKEKPDIVFSSFLDRARILSVFRRTHLLKTKTRLVFRCLNTPSKMDESFNRILRIWFKYADVVISQTKEMANELVSISGINEEKVVTINNPIDKTLIKKNIKEKYEYDHTYCNYLGVGRIAPEKNFVNLIRAFAIVKEKSPQSRLYIVGNDNNTEEKQKLEQLIIEYKLTEDVYFEGFQCNPFKYIKDCDCFVLSSNVEGLPNVMLEAMYLGRPVAATTCVPYIAQVVTNGVNGYTCPIDNPEKLADAMLSASKIKNIPMYNDITQSEEKIINLFNAL